MITVKIMDFNSFYSFNELTTIDTITTQIIPFVDTTSLGSVILKDNGVAVPYIEYAEDLDKVENAGHFTITPSNQVMFLLDKTDALDTCKAKDYIVGFVLEYPTKPLKYVGTPECPLYRVVVMRGSDGVITNVYDNMNSVEVVQLMKVLDGNLSINVVGGSKYVISQEVTDGVIGVR